MRFTDSLMKAAETQHLREKGAPKPSHGKVNPVRLSGPLPCWSSQSFHPGQGKGDSVSSLVITARSGIQCHVNRCTPSILTRGLWGTLRLGGEKELARGRSGHRTERELSRGSSSCGAWSLGACGPACLPFRQSQSTIPQSEICRGQIRPDVLWLWRGLRAPLVATPASVPDCPHVGWMDYNFLLLD